MAIRPQDLLLLLNALIIYNNEITVSINASPSALFINPTLLRHAVHGLLCPADTPSTLGALKAWHAPALLPAHAGQNTALSLCTFPEAACTFSGSQTLQEHLVLPEYVPQSKREMMLHGLNNVVLSTDGSWGSRAPVPSHLRHVVRRSELGAKEGPAAGCSLLPAVASCSPGQGAEPFGNVLCPQPGCSVSAPGPHPELKAVVKLCSSAPS